MEMPKKRGLPFPCGYLFFRGVGVGFGWGGVPQRKSEGLRFTSALNCGKILAGRREILHDRPDLRATDLRCGLKVLEDCPEFSVGFLETRNQPPRIFTQRADVCRFQCGLNFRQQGLQVLANLFDLRPQ